MRVSQFRVEPAGPVPAQTPATRPLLTQGDLHGVPGSLIRMPVNYDVEQHKDEVAATSDRNELGRSEVLTW